MIAGASTSCFYPLETEKALDLIGRAWFRKAEIFFNAQCELDNAFVAELNTIRRHYGLEIVSIHPFSSFMETQCIFGDYARRFHDILPLYERYFEICAQLGAKYVVLHGALKKTKMPIPDERYFERFNFLADLAKQHGVVLLQENVNLFKSESIEFLKRMREAVRSNFKLVFDVKQAIRAGQDVFEFIDTFSSDICHVHLSDNTPERDCLPPGRGTFDIKRLKSKLLLGGYTGDYIIEIYSPGFDVEQELVRSRIFLEGI